MRGPLHVEDVLLYVVAHPENEEKADLFGATLVFWMSGAGAREPLRGCAPRGFWVLMYEDW